MDPVCIADYRLAARRRLPRFLFDYIDGGAHNEETLSANTDDLRRLSLRQHVLRDVSEIDTSTTLFGQTVRSPIILGPVGLAGMNARRGEVQALKAAEARVVPFCLSTVSVCSIEEVAAAAAQPFWFQLYMMRDRAFVSELMDRAWNLGVRTLVFTVDMPLPGKRYRDYRSGLAGGAQAQGGLKRLSQAALHPGWALDVGLLGRPHSLGNIEARLGQGAHLADFFGWMAANFDPTVTWSDLQWVRDRWLGNLVIKGVLDRDDAIAAADLGADGLVVSNHGGRQLDGAPSTVVALPAIVEAVGDRLTILVDGGVRSGADIVRMLALGARAVLIGRPWAYGLAAKGQRGVEHVIDLLTTELLLTLALTGHASAERVDRAVLFKT